MSKSICFLTGGIESGPVGGYKVIYEYANRFVADGWDVTIAYPFCGSGNTFPKYLFKHPIHALAFLRSYPLQRLKGVKGGCWFPLDSRVKKVYPLQNSPSLAHRFAKGTKFFATYISTVFDLERFNIPSEDKFNLVQDFEAWFGMTPEEVFETYRFQMTKIAISDWLAEKVADAGSNAIVVPNGLDFRYFHLARPIESRSKMEIAMLWHRDERKRTEDAVAALRLVHGKYPTLHVTAFGALPQPDGLPDWITYYQRPDRETHNKIYNDAAIFVASSEQEGWGLTPCEAMICGAAVACTDIGGYRMFAKNEETALLSPSRDVQKLADNICRLIEDDALRTKLASEAQKNIRQFTWEKSFEKLKNVLLAKSR